MNTQLDTKTPGKYIFIPVLYLILITAMLYLQFGKSIPFHDTFKDIDITGRKSAGSNSRGLSEIRLEYGEFSLAVTPSKSLSILTDSGPVPLALTGYAKYPDRLEVRFSHGLMLVIVQEPETGRTRVLYESDADPIQQITLPFELRNPQEISRIEGFPVLQHRSKSSGDGYFVRLPAGSSIDAAQGILTITPEKERQLITIESGDTDSIIAYWFSVQPLSITTREYQRTVNQFIARSYRGWKTERYDAVNGGWKVNTANTYDQNLLSAYGAEAFNRQEGYTFISRIVPAVPDQSSGYLSNPFTGNIVNTSNGLISDTQNALTIADSGSIKSVDEALQLLRFMDLLPSQSIESLSEGLKTILKKRDDTPAALQAASAYLQQHMFGALSDEGMQCLEEVLLPRITPYKEGYIFESRDGVSDSYLGILTGLILAETEQKELYTHIGQSAVATYLEMADSAGRIPRELIKDDLDWQKSPESLFPEEIYPLLIDSPYYPRATGLRSGIWTWTCAGSIEAVTRGNQIVITSSFPVDGIYHITVSGVEPFTSLSLYGIQWNSDPQFQRYSSGWVYNPERKMLFLKIKQRRPVESIIIDYAPAPVQVEEEITKPIFAN